MRHIIRLLLMAALLSVSSMCNIAGPSERLTGMWRANVGDKFTFVTMVLEQRGDEISGTACGSAAGMVMFRNAPVRGEYPHVQFDVAATYVEPCCGALTGSRFAGRRDSSGDIVGQYNGRDVRFGRTSDPVCR